MGPESTSNRDVRLTLKQRVGLIATELPYRARQHLTLGRAGAALFAWQATFALAAAVARGDLLGAQLPVVVAASVAYAIAALILLAFERMGRLSTNLLAGVGSGMVTLLILSQSDSDIYGWLYVLPVFFVSFFLRPRQALLHVAAILVAFGLALLVAEPSREALADWILGGGPLVGSATLIVVVRLRMRRLVDSRTRAFQRERESRALLDAFFEHAPVAVSFVDRDLRYVRVNDSFAASCGIDPATAVGMSVGTVWPDVAGQTVPLLRRVLETGEPAVGEELTGEAPPGSGLLQHWLVSCYPVPAADGEIVGVASIAVESTAIKQVETRLEELLAIEQATRLEIEISRHDLEQQANIDSLTGLLNRSSLSDHLDLALARAERGSLAVALLYVDLDGFKAVNDTLGHAAGDELLCAFASRLRAAARKTDVVARLGGDEFLVLVADLPKSDANDVARAIAERIIHDVSAPVQLECGEGHVAASVGISLYPTDAACAAELIANADVAMYTSKRSGKGRARFYAESQEAVA
jgi:diguanylate cyclase (GGDEF)-like protein/PAS domain S-box-containing protein